MAMMSMTPVRASTNARPSSDTKSAAAVASQRALEDREWPEGARVKVRMGLHTGQGRLGGDNYVGLDVHRAARIAAAGRGGQLLVSETTRSLVQDALPDARDPPRPRRPPAPRP